MTVLIHRFTEGQQERFWSSVDKSGECWSWRGGKQSVGYGVFYWEPGRQILAHRFAYIEKFGEIGTGLYVCHRCDNRLCVRWEHLYVGTQFENLADMTQKGRRAIGSTHGNTKLSGASVKEILNRYRRRVVTQAQLAAEYSVSRQTISAIILRKTRLDLEA